MTPQEEYMRLDALQAERELFNPRYWEDREVTKCSLLSPRALDRFFNPPAPPPTPEERKELLDSIQFDRPSPAEVDAMARVDELRRKHGREPHEL